MNNLTSFTSNHFTLTFQQKPTYLYMRMHVLSSILTTEVLPKTSLILQTILPTISYSECFNNLHLPFREEMKHTEIGHLFEHIMLEYLYQIKRSATQKNYVIKGETVWNWEKDQRGVFHITINLKQQDSIFLSYAIEKSISLLLTIMNTAHESLLPFPSSHPFPSFVVNKQFMQ